MVVFLNRGANIDQNALILKNRGPQIRYPHFGKPLIGWDQRSACDSASAPLGCCEGT